MVQGQRLLLSALFGGLLCACKAEDLGVELPRGGAEAISQEDLRRDSWRIAEQSTSALAAGAVAERLGQMKTHPAFGGEWMSRPGEGLAVCARKEGKEKQAVLVLALGPADQPEGAIAWAALISLAKGLDERQPPARTVLLCAVTDEATATALLLAPPLPVEQLGRRIRLGPLGGSELRQEAGQSWTWFHASGAPPTLGEVDYRVVEAQVRQALGWLREEP